MGWRRWQLYFWNSLFLFTGTVIFALFVAVILFSVVVVFAFTGTVVFDYFLFQNFLKLLGEWGGLPVRAKPHEPVYAYMYIERLIYQPVFTEISTSSFFSTKKTYFI